MQELSNRWYRRLFASVELKLLFAWIAVVLVTLALDSGRTYWYSAEASAIVILRNTVLLGFFALGSAVIIISGGIDLSSGSVIALSATVFGSIIVILEPTGVPSNSTIALAFAGTILSGLMVGTLHAWLITCVGLPPFIATLASLVGLRSLGRGLTQAVTNGRSQIEFPSHVALRESLRDVTYITIAFVVFALLIWFLMSFTVFGRHLHAMGGNEQAAKLSGIRTNRLKWAAYVIGSVSASIVGIIYFADNGSAKPDIMARGYELNAIAASVIGGCSLQGGIGTMPGVVLGCLFLRTVIDAVNKIVGTGADVYEGTIVGLVVVLAVTFSQRASTAVRKVFFADMIGWFTVPVLALLSGLSFGLFFREKQWFAISHAIVFGLVVAVLLVIRGVMEALRQRKAA